MFLQKYFSIELIQSQNTRYTDSGNTVVTNISLIINIKFAGHVISTASTTIYLE